MPEKAIQVVKDESKSGVIPSTQVIKMVLAKIKGSSSFELIEKFRFSLPFETEAYELVCEAELQQKCQNPNNKKRLCVCLCVCPTFKTRDPLY